MRPVNQNAICAHLGHSRMPPDKQSAAIVVLANTRMKLDKVDVKTALQEHSRTTPGGPSVWTVPRGPSRI
jgi:hypothetical protein